jgi:hypothetical protein
LAAVPIVLLALACVGVAGCALLPGRDEGSTDGIVVENRTGTTLRFEVVVDGRLLTLATKVAPHHRETVLYAGALEPGHCTTEPIVAFSTSDGREIARQDQPLCVGEAWTIEEPSTSP